MGLEGNFLHTIEHISETNNEVKVVRHPEIHAEGINEVFVCDILWWNATFIFISFWSGWGNGEGDCTQFKKDSIELFFKNYLLTTTM